MAYIPVTQRLLEKERIEKAKSDQQAIKAWTGGKLPEKKTTAQASSVPLRPAQVPANIPVPTNNAMGGLPKLSTVAPISTPKVTPKIVTPTPTVTKKATPTSTPTIKPTIKPTTTPTNMPKAVQSNSTSGNLSIPEIIEKAKAKQADEEYARKVTNAKFIDSKSMKRPLHKKIGDVISNVADTVKSGVIGIAEGFGSKALDRASTRVMFNDWSKDYTGTPDEWKPDWILNNDEKTNLNRQILGGQSMGMSDNQVNDAIEKAKNIANINSINDLTEKVRFNKAYDEAIKGEGQILKQKKEGELLRDRLGKDYNWSPEDDKYITTANDVGKTIGNFGQMVAVDALTGNPFIGGFVSGATNAYGEGGDTNEVLKSGVKSGVFNLAGSKASKAVGGMAGKILGKTPIKDTLAATFLKNTAKGAAFGAGGTATEFVTSDEKPTAKDFAKSMAVGALFELVPTAINAPGLSKYNKSKVIENMKTYEQEMKQSYQDAKLTSNPDTAMSKYDSMIKRNDDIIKGLDLNEFPGASKEVNQVKNTINTINNVLRKERSGIVNPKDYEAPSMLSKKGVSKPEPVNKPSIKSLKAGDQVELKGIGKVTVNEYSADKVSFTRGNGKTMTANPNVFNKIVNPTSIVSKAIESYKTEAVNSVKNEESVKDNIETLKLEMPIDEPKVIKAGDKVTYGNIGEVTINKISDKEVELIKLDGSKITVDKSAWNRKIKDIVSSNIIQKPEVVSNTNHIPEISENNSEEFKVKNDELINPQSIKKPSAKMSDEEYIKLVSGEIPLDTEYLDKNKKIEGNEYNQNLYDNDLPLLEGDKNEKRAENMLDGSQDGIKTKEAVKKEKATVSLNKAIEKLKKEGIPEVNAEIVEPKTSTQRQIKDVLSKLGFDVQYYTSKNMPAMEVYDPENPNTILVRNNNKNDMLWAAGHGFFHGVKVNHPDLYKQVYDVLEETITPEQIDKYVSTFDDTPEYQKTFEGNKDAIIEEMLADESGNIFVDKTFWEKVYMKSKQLFNDLIEVARKMFSKLSGNTYENYFTLKQQGKYREQFESVIKEVRSRVKNNKTKEIEVSNGEVKFSIQNKEESTAKPFYSKLEKTITDKMPKAAFVQDIRGIINSANIKADEIKWSGIDTYLNSRIGSKITKEELQGFLKMNELQIEEITKGELSEEYKNELSKAENNMYKEKDKAYKALIESGVNQVDTMNIINKVMEDRFDELTNKEISLSTKASDYDLNDLYDTSRDYHELEQTKFQDNPPIKYKDYQLAGGENYKELLFRIPQGESRSYLSSHWDEKNVLAHTRFNDRTDKQGNKILFIEEIQSDWHQDGRKKGYGDQAKEKELIKKVKELGLDPEKSTGREIEAAGGSEELALEFIENRFNKVPEAPFAKTWHEFVLKRLIRYAAENGYDKVAWTTGDQQAERYDLSKKVGYITWNKEPYPKDEGKIFVSVSDTGDKTLLKGNMTPNEIEDNIGKELAKKIIDGDMYGKLEGLDLKMGGDGMKGFYDKMIPDYLNKYLKKWGTKVRDVSIQSKEYDVPDYVDNWKDNLLDEYKEDAEWMNGFVSKWVDIYNNQLILKENGEDFRNQFTDEYGYAFEDKFLENIIKEKEREKSQPGFELTSEMINSVMTEGQPLFSMRRREIRKSSVSETEFEDITTNNIRDTKAKYHRNISVAEGTGLSKSSNLSVSLSDKDSGDSDASKTSLMTGSARPGMRQSQFAVNTLLRSMNLPDDLKVNLKLGEFDYIPETKEEWQDQAIKNIQNDESKVINDIYNSESISGGVQAYEAAIITKKLITEANNTKTVNKLREWLQTVGDKTRESARALKGTDTAWEKNSPEGMLIQAEREIKGSEDKIKDENPNLIDEINKETEDIVKKIKEVDREAIDKIGKEADDINSKNKEELSPEEILAKKIISHISPKTKAETILLKKMVSDLFNKAVKESPIKSGTEVKSTDTYSGLARAMKNNTKYSETWNRAKDILKETFKDNEPVLNSLDNYFNKGIKPPFEISKMDSAIKDALKANNLNLSDVVKDYFRMNQNTRGDLKEYIISKTGLEGAEAERLSKYFDNRFKELTKERKEKILKNWFATKGAKSKSALKKINELTNLGAFENENYKNAVMEKVTPLIKQLIKENKINLNELVRKGFDITDMTKSNFVTDVQSGLRVNKSDWQKLRDIARSEFSKLAEYEREKILNNMFKPKIPTSPKTMYDKVMELINLGAYDKESIRDLIKQKNGLPILENSDVKFILKTMSAAEKLEAGSYGQKVLQAKAMQRISDKIPTGFIEKFQAIQRISMLLNPKTTVIRNPLGNILLGAAENLKDGPGIVIDKATSKILGTERTKTFDPKGKIQAELKGTSKGLKEWALDIKNGVDTSTTEGGVELPKNNKIFNENTENETLRVINKKANQAHGIVSKMLRLGDTPFFNGAYEKRLVELKKIKNTNEITDDMKEEARRYALERTLQDDSSISKTLMATKRGDWFKNPGSKLVWKLVTNLILPFAKTPGNIANKFIEYSPGGALKALGHAGMSFKKGTFNQRYFVDNLARSLTGTGMILIGYLLAKNDIITGAPNKDKKVSAIETSLGKKNYAFKIGDTYQSYDWAQPAAAPLAMGADIFNAINNTKGDSNAAFSGLESSINLLFNSTVLQGPARLMKGYSPATSITDSLLGSSTQFTPTVSKQIAQMIDPTQRETYDPNALKETLNKTVSRVPGLSKTLPPKLDVFGEDRTEDNVLTNALNVLVNPGNASEYKLNEMQKEIIRLYEDSGQTEHLPPVAEKSFNATKNHPKIVLSAKEYNDYQRKIGKDISDKFEQKINAQVYKKADDKEKVKMLSQIIDDVKSSAKDSIINSHIVQSFEEEYSRIQDMNSSNYTNFNKANEEINAIKVRTEKILKSKSLTQSQKDLIEAKSKNSMANIASKALKTLNR